MWWVYLFLVLYVCSSYLFWCYPHLLHRRKQILFTAKNISHRGGSGEGYENTIRAFRNAIQASSDMLELDVRFSKDRQVVVCHDYNLLRLTGINVNLASLEFSKLPPLLSSLRVDTIPGFQFCDPTWTRVEDRAIPKLSQVFEQFPTTPIHLDVCAHSQNFLCCDVLQLIQAHKRGHITVWGSSEFSLCSNCQKVGNTGLDPVSMEPYTFFSSGRFWFVTLTAFVGLLPFIPLKETHYSIFLPQCITSVAKDWGLSRIQLIVVKYSGMLLVWKPLLQHLQRRGIKVYFWVANNEDEFRACDAYGVDGIMTDYPSRLSKYYLAKHN